LKKIFLILVLIIAISAKDTYAQNGVPNTLAYLQTIVDNKSNYIGQPFSVLLDSLQIQIKYFSRFPGLHHDKTKETSTSFSFYLPQDDFNDFYLTYPKLEIYWQPYLNATQSVFYLEIVGGNGILMHIIFIKMLSLRIYRYEIEKNIFNTGFNNSHICKRHKGLKWCT